MGCQLALRRFVRGAAHIGMAGMKKVLILGLLSGAVSSQALIIDSFATGPFSVSIQSSSYVATQNGSMSSGERDVEARVYANPFNQWLDVSINSGLNVVSNGFGVASKVTLQYDMNGDEVGNTGAGKLLNTTGAGAPILSVGADDRLRLTFLGNDSNVTVTATVKQGNTQLAQAMATKSAGGGGVLDLVVGNSALANADSVTLEFEADPSGDFALAEIGTVPEPMTVAVLGLGALALARRRRKA